MNYIAQKLEERLVSRPDHAFLYDELTPKGLTYERLYGLSGRVYAYLKARGIGREDFVLISLPRGVQPLVAMLGVWRAGAAFALAVHYAASRYETATVEAFRDTYAAVCRLLVAHTEQSALTFGMIRDRICGRPSLWQRLRAFFAGHRV